MKQRERIDLVHAPDLGAVAELMNRTWPRPTWRYSPATLASYLERPSGAPDLAIGWRRNGHLAAFMAGSPFDGVLHGKPLRAVFTSFLTADEEASVYGASQAVLQRLLETVRQRGFTHYVTLMATASRTSRLIETLHARQGCHLSHVATIRYWIGVPDTIARSLAGVPTIAAMPYEPALASRCHELLESLAQRLELAKLPPLADMDAMLGGDSVTRLLVRERVLGMIVARVRTVLHERERRFVYLDLVHVDDLEEPEQEAFFCSVLAELLALAPDVVVVPSGGCPKPALLRKRSFITAPTAMGVHMAHLHDDRELAKVASCWLEVY